MLTAINCCCNVFITERETDQPTTGDKIVKIRNLHKKSISDTGLKGVNQIKVNALVSLATDSGYKLVCPRSCKKVYAALSQTGLFVRYTSTSAIFYMR